jgi:predicted tellurium resistance membrane protein TerC
VGAWLAVLLTLLLAKGVQHTLRLLLAGVVVGVVLVAEGFGHHVPKGYIYFGMAFSFGVEMLNIRFRKKRSNAVQLRQPTMPGEDD